MPPKPTAAASLDALDKDRAQRQATFKEKAKKKAEEVAKKAKGKLPASWDVSGNLSHGAKCLRYFIILCNVALFIFACWVLVRSSYNKAMHVYALLETWFTPAIVLGCFFLLLSFVGTGGSWFMNRIALWIYGILLALFGFITMVVSSYALAKVNDGSGFLTNAWVNSPEDIRLNLEKTFNCCGLNTFMDADAVIPCPPESYENATYTTIVRNATMSASNITGYGCMESMLEQFNQYSTSIPVAGIIMWIVVTIFAALAIKLARLISKALSENSVEMV